MKLSQSPLRARPLSFLSLLAGLVCLVVSLAPSVRAQAQLQSPVPIGGLEFQDKPFQKFKPEVEAVLRGYYAAVEAGDFDKALTYYAWAPVSNLSLPGAHQNVLEAAQIVKEQIDRNGGLRRAAVYGIFRRGRDLVAIVELEFNNGHWDLSPEVLFGYDGDWGKSAWKLFVTQWGSSVAPPIAGQGEMLATFELVYRAALAGDTQMMRALSYEDPLDVAQREGSAYLEEQRQKLFDAVVASSQTMPRVSGGVVSIDIPRMDESSVYVGATRALEPIAIGSIVVRRTYKNGRSDSHRVGFSLDSDGRWKVNPNTLR